MITVSSEYKKIMSLLWDLMAKEENFKSWELLHKAYELVFEAKCEKEENSEPDLVVTT